MQISIKDPSPWSPIASSVCPPDSPPVYLNFNFCFSWLLHKYQQLSHYHPSPHDPYPTQVCICQHSALWSSSVLRKISPFLFTEFQQKAGMLLFSFNIFPYGAFKDICFHVLLSQPGSSASVCFPACDWCRWIAFFRKRHFTQTGAWKPVSSSSSWEWVMGS